MRGQDAVLEVPLPALKHTDCTDYNKNQRKRFSDWATVCKTFKRYLEEAGFEVERNPTGSQCAEQFQNANDIHNRLVRAWHPSSRKRRQRRNGDIAKRVSTVLLETRAMKKHKKWVAEKLNQIEDGSSSVFARHHSALDIFVDRVKSYLFRKNLGGEGEGQSVYDASTDDSDSDISYFGK